MIYRSSRRFIQEGVEGVILLLAVFITWPVSRRWLDNWGSASTERQKKWFGDSFAPSAVDITTRAVSIEASRDRVWPWIVQFGLGRAGFYSYEVLERLAGIPVKNIESIVQEYQTLSVGDEIKLHPTAPGIPVGEIKAPEMLCFGEREFDPESNTDPRRSWSMYLVPESDASCRLVLRGCVESLREPTFLKRLGLAVTEPIDFVMEQRMLRTLRRLAEESSEETSNGSFQQRLAQT